MLRLIKDKGGFKVAGIYCVPCECSKVCVGQTGRLIKTWCKEHVRYICLGQSEKSAVAEHRFETGHTIDFNNTSILDKATGYMDQMIKEAIEIRLYPNNFSRVLGFTFNWSWHPLTNMIKKYTDASIQRQAKAKQALDSAR
jgi:hypothetical protein